MMRSLKPNDRESLKVDSITTEKELTTCTDVQLHALHRRYGIELVTCASPRFARSAGADHTTHAILRVNVNRQTGKRQTKCES